MTSKTSGRQKALITALLAGSMLLTTAPAMAQSGGADRLAGARSVERMRGYSPREYRDAGPSTRDYRRRDYRGSSRDYRGGYSRGFGFWGSRRDAYDDAYNDPQPDPVVAHVASPQYHTYTADRLKTVSLASLAQAIGEARAAERTRAAAEAAKNARALDAEGDALSRAAPVAAPTGGETPEASAFLASLHALDTIEIRALPQVVKALEAYYTKQPDFVWVKAGHVTDRARAVIAVLEQADSVGLDPADYAVEIPGNTVASYHNIEVAAADPIQSDGSVQGEIATDAPSPGSSVSGVSDEGARDGALMRFEMELTAKALTYALDAERGRIEADRISGYHDLPRHKVDLEQDMANLAASDDPGPYLRGRNPSNAQFDALVKTLADLRSQSDHRSVTIAKGTLVKPGQSSPEMANVVKAIRLNGSQALKNEHSVALASYDGGDEYTPQLVSMVKDFQRDSGLGVDGVVGRNTVRALVGISLDSKIEKVKLAMERLRWLPRDLGERRVFINEPAFTATYIEPGRDPFVVPAVVGRKANQTNFFYDTIETVEYNPYWGVPYSIIVNEMIPKLNRDPSYLDHAGYEVTTANGRKVSSASVNWRAVARKKMSVNVRQYPGPRNALGQLKILFPNSHSIYMHDTPAKNLFTKDVRAFSHGCVRLKDPWGMAAAVLGKPESYVRERIAQGKNVDDSVPGNIPVYVAYFTAWPSADGTMAYFNDIYDRDMYLQKAIDTTIAERRG